MPVDKEDSERLRRIEQKLDHLIAALADETEEVDKPATTLDGNHAGEERDATQPL